MILQRFRGKLLVVRQPDHGKQTGDFARHWGNDETPPFEPREAAIDAGTRHDNGWAGWEERPTIDPNTGQPWQFHSLTPHEHVPLYRRGINMAAEHDPYTGLLVSMHGAGLYNDRYGTFRLTERSFTETERELVNEFLEEQALFQQSLGERALRKKLHTHVTTDPNVWYTYLLLQVWDRLQLQFGFRLAANGEIAPLPRPDGTSGVLTCRNVGELALRLDPYPFDEDRRVFPLEARLLEDRPYGQPEAFLAAMAAAPITTLECRVSRE
ncbi:MAG: DUF3891 family protein [Chloroflexota bacterium]